MIRFFVWVFLVISFLFYLQASSSAAYATTYAIMVPSEPIVTEQSGTIHPVTTGQQVIVSTTVQSNANDTRDYVVIIEIRNSNGITENLNWQSGRLEPRGMNQVGVSWIPSEAGAYEIRTFVLSELKNPQLYSAVITSKIDVASS